MSGVIRQVSNYFSKNKPTIWHFRLTSSLNSQTLEDNLTYLRAMRHKEGSVFALSISSTQTIRSHQMNYFINLKESRDTSRTFAFYDALKQASERLRAPLYTFAEDQALGDSYLLLSLGEQVTASVSSRIHYISFEKLFEKIGINYDVYTHSQPSFLPSRKPTPSDIQLAEQSNKEVLESIQELILQKRHKAFENKGISREQAKKDLLSGQAFTADEALKNGLIDNIGTFYDFKDTSYPNHQIRTAQKYPGHIEFFPKLNRDILVLVQMIQELEVAMQSTQSGAPMQTVVANAEVRLAEFFTRKLKEPEFLIAFENYLMTQFEEQQSLINRRQDLINMLY